jgi:hypothetical protein
LDHRQHRGAADRRAFWSFCGVYIQEPISGSDSVRIAFDNVLYALVLGLLLPLAVGVRGHGNRRVTE